MKIFLKNLCLRRWIWLNINPSLRSFHLGSVLTLHQIGSFLLPHIYNSLPLSSQSSGQQSLVLELTPRRRLIWNKVPRNIVLESAIPSEGMMMMRIQSCNNDDDSIYKWSWRGSNLNNFSDMCMEHDLCQGSRLARCHIENLPKFWDFWQMFAVYIMKLFHSFITVFKLFTNVCPRKTFTLTPKKYVTHSKNVDKIYFERNAFLNEGMRFVECWRFHLCEAGFTVCDFPFPCQCTEWEVGRLWKAHSVFVQLLSDTDSHFKTSLAEVPWCW